jgi:asparagine synthase (glutamine-hydrolysing)
MTAPDIELASLLEKASKRISKDIEHGAIAFSGGLDSSVVAALLKDKCRVALYTAGVDGAHDLVAAEDAAAVLGMRANKIHATMRDIEDAVTELVQITGSHEPLSLSIGLPIYLVAYRCRETVIFTGQGADELFGGYHRYLSLDAKALEAALENDLGKLLAIGVGVEKKIAGHFGKEIRYLFLDEMVRQYAMSLPLKEKVDTGERKIILRKAAVLLGLPESIARSRKKAAQYSSGVTKAMRKIANGRGMTVREWVDSFPTR